MGPANDVPFFISPPFVLRDNKASETRARLKITLREKRRHEAGREKNASPLSRVA